jgi:hypothetical protein
MSIAMDRTIERGNAIESQSINQVLRKQMLDMQLEE